MSCVEYERVELTDSGSKNGGSVQRAKLYVVPGRRDRHGDQVALRLAEVLDLELAQGSMPA